MEKPTRLLVKKCGFLNAGLSVFIVLRIGDDKTSWFYRRKHLKENGISMGRGTQIRIRASSTRQVFFNETKVPVENMLSEGNGFKITMNALNVGRIKLCSMS
jgi:alkylation response protein AidB-like acyl-CoA dehydrogenase